MSTVQVRDGYLRVLGLDGDHVADFHLRWLRHNCRQDLHPLTHERTVDSAQLPDALAVTAAAIEPTSDGAALTVRWAHDGRVSSYPLAWLAQHAYALDRADVPLPPSDVARLTVDGTGRELAQLVPAALARLEAHGAAVVRRDASDATPPEEQTEALIAAFAAHGLRIIGTHFGRIEDLRTDNTTNANTDQLGYTDAGIALHTDQPFLDRPPRYQMLQAIRRADRGGENQLADARAAFRYFETVDADAAQILRATPIRFHRKQAAFERVVVSPIVVDDGGRFQVRSSYFTLAPFRVSFARMEAWYRAYDRWNRLLHDPAHHYELALAPGDFLVYDNHRMLHGRSAFSGPRWVRGIYFDPV